MMTKTKIINNKDILENNRERFSLKVRAMWIFSVCEVQRLFGLRLSEVLRGRRRRWWWVLGTGDTNTGKDENVCSSPRGGCQLSLNSGTSSGELRNSEEKY